MRYVVIGGIAAEIHDLRACPGWQLTSTSRRHHLMLLRDAGLVTVRIDANRRLYRADLQRVGEIASFLDEFWAAPLQRPRATAESIATQPANTRPKQRSAS